MLSKMALILAEYRAIIWPHDKPCETLWRWNTKWIGTMEYYPKDIKEDAGPAYAAAASDGISLGEAYHELEKICPGWAKMVDDDRRDDVLDAIREYTDFHYGN